MSRARDSALVPLEPESALGLWTDPRRWPGFIEGFARATRIDPAWPAPGAELVWESGAGGRGRVTERVEEYHSGGRIVTRVTDPSLTGVQTVSFRPEAGGARVDLELDYELTSPGALGRITDVLFIRRALTASLVRTLESFAREAQADASAA